MRVCEPSLNVSHQGMCVCMHACTYAYMYVCIHTYSHICTLSHKYTEYICI